MYQSAAQANQNLSALDEDYLGALILETILIFRNKKIKNRFMEKEYNLF